MKLYDAPACPFCARVRLVLAEKGCAFETVEIDLRDRPESLLRLNPSGRVPVLEDGFVLPESLAIMEYLEERYPSPALLPRDPRERALARVALVRFDEQLGRPYYARRRDEGEGLERRLDELPLGLSLFSAYAYVPWVIRLRERMGVELPTSVARWLGKLARRPAVAAELALVRAAA